MAVAVAVAVAVAAAVVRVEIIITRVRQGPCYELLKERPGCTETRWIMQTTCQIRN